MRHVVLPALLGLAACTQATSGERPAAAMSAGEAPERDLAARRDSLAEIVMTTDTAYLTAEDREVVNLLIEASGYMSEIYRRQRLADYDQVRSAIERSRRGDRDLLLDLFDRNFGPWDEGAELHPFYGDTPMPEGAGFYPADLTREEFDTFLAANPDQRDELMSPYTIVKRDGEGFTALYQNFLETQVASLGLKIRL